MICLSRNELKELTGYKRPKYVKQWLITNGIQFYIGADGWPRVLRATLPLLNKHDTLPPQPDWNAV